MTTAIAPDHRVKTRLPDNVDNSAPKPLATFLGLFSLGLGLAEALAPRAMARATGVRRPALLRGYGLREIASGVGILAGDNPALWLWSRVGGDAIDLATLASFTAQTDRPGNVIMALGMVAGVGAMDVKCALQLGELPDTDGGRGRAA